MIRTILNSDLSEDQNQRRLSHLWNSPFEESSESSARPLSRWQGVWRWQPEWKRRKEAVYAQHLTGSCHCSGAHCPGAQLWCTTLVNYSGVQLKCTNSGVLLYHCVTGNHSGVPTPDLKVEAAMHNSVVPMYHVLVNSSVPLETILVNNQSRLLDTGEPTTDQKPPWFTNYWLTEYS